jgi:hypothetical protein
MAPCPARRSIQLAHGQTCVRSEGKKSSDTEGTEVSQRALRLFRDQDLFSPCSRCLLCALCVTLFSQLARAWQQHKMAWRAVECVALAVGSPVRQGVFRPVRRTPWYPVVLPKGLPGWIIRKPLDSICSSKTAMC